MESSKNKKEEYERPTVHTTSNGGLYVNVSELLQSKNAKIEIERMSKLRSSSSSDDERPTSDSPIASNPLNLL